MSRYTSNTHDSIDNVPILSFALAKATMALHSWRFQLQKHTWFEGLPSLDLSLSLQRLWHATPVRRS